MIQQAISQYKFSTKDYLNPNSSFKLYIPKLEELNVSPKIEEVQGQYQSTEGIQESSEQSYINRKSKIHKNKDKPYKSETKNIPKNFGVLLKKYLCSKNTRNEAIKAFLDSGENKKNFSRQDFTQLFNDDQAANLSREYFSGFQIIHDLMISEKIQDVKTHLKYIGKFYNSTFNREELDELKLQ